MNDNTASICTILIVCVFVSVIIFPIKGCVEYESCLKTCNTDTDKNKCIKACKGED